MSYVFVPPFHSLTVTTPVAGGNYSVVAGPGYDSYQLPYRKLSLGAMPGAYAVAGNDAKLVKA